MADIVKQLLAKPIQYADEVIKLAGEASFMKAECTDIKTKTEKLATLLRQAARASGDLYERPTRRIIQDTEQVLDKALTLVFKCRHSGLRRFFTIIPAAAFRKLSQQLENSIGDVSWLLRVSGDRDDDILGLPPIAANEPILCLIWEQIAILFSGSMEEKSDAAASLVSLARDNDRYVSLIIEEGGVPPLLKLAKEGMMEGQENAARAIGLLGRDPESIEHIVNAGVCQVFAKLLKEATMKVQIVVTWALSELAAHHPKCQDPFAQHHIIRLLVSHLAFETIPEHSKYAITSKQSIHSIVMANSSTGKTTDERETSSFTAYPMNNHIMPSQMQNVFSNTIALKSTMMPEPFGEKSGTTKQNHQPQKQQQHHHHHQQQPGSSIKRREFEDPSIKAEMKAMAARALHYLCAGNVAVCQSITESRALLCLAVLLEKGEEDVKYNSAMALMEITAVAEQNSDLRRSAFKPTAPVAKAVVDQFLHW